VEGREIGAFEREEVIRRIRAGEIRRDARVWKDGMPDWVDAGSLPELEDHFGPPPDTIVTATPPPPRPAATTGQSKDAETLYEKGLFARKRGDFDEAFSCFSKAAEQGNASSQFALGSLYFQGKGVAADRAKSAEWYRKAADQGHQGAQYSLGDAYYNGWGVPEDLAKAAEWYRKAAEQGYEGAQYELGRCYHEGKGVPKDYGKAAEWYSKAAAQGNAYAQKVLAILKKERKI
jgi:TPR repeat protein